jgi:RimJ/RimL family protein N-acetyltransferase
MESSRLKLHPPSMKHQPLMLAAIQESQAELGEFLPWVRFSLTEEESINNAEKAISNFKKFEGELRYSILDKTSGNFIGAIGLIIRDKEIPTFEIGYWLRSSYVGQGYITEAVKLVEEYAFNELKAKRVEIRASDRNVKSYSVAERCGYQYEGKLHNHRMLPNGEIGHTVVYAKTSL